MTDQSTHGQKEGGHVDATRHDDDQAWGRYDEELEQLPPRPRHRFLTPWTALLFAVVVGAAAFYAGVRVEKGQLAGSSATGVGALASRFAALRSSAGAGRFGSGGGGGFGALFGRGGGATVGTVSSIDGKTLYVTTTSGNTVKVTLSSATTITKNEPAGRSRIFPGDSVVVAGVSEAGGTLSATTVTDSGARSAAGASGTGSGAGSARSAISSLFSGG